MGRLPEPSHLDLCCLQKPIIIDCVAVKELIIVHVPEQKANVDNSRVLFFIFCKIIVY